MGGWAGLVAAAAAATLAAACGVSEADKSADQILADAQAAISSVHSYRLEFHGQSRSGSEQFLFDVADRHSAKGTLTIEATTAQFVLSAGTFYLRGRDFLARFNGPRAAEVAGDRWVALPTAAIGPVNLFSDTVTLARCVLGNHGTLTKAGTSTVAGVGAVILDDRGDRPATSPGRISVAVSGPAYPLRLDQTGPQRSGSPPQGCSGSAASPDDPTAVITGTAALSDFGAAISVAAPTGAIPLPT